MESPQFAPGLSIFWSTGLLARVRVCTLLDLVQDLAEVVTSWILHWRKRLVGLELLQPQQLANGQEVPVVEIGRAWGCQRTAVGDEAFYITTDRDLERITLDVGDLGP